MFKRSLANNIRYYKLYYFLSGFIFQIPIWVAFYTNIITLPELAVINALESVFTLVLEVPTGALADLIGRRKTVMVGSLLLVAFFCLIPFARSFWGIFALVFMSGAGSALISGADAALIYDTIKELGQEKEIGQIYANVGLLYRIGLVCATFLGGYLFTTWRGLPYIARALTTLGAAFFIWRMVEPSIDSEKFSWGKYITQTRAGIRELTKSRYLKELSVYYIAIAGISFACLTFFNQPFGYAFGYTPMQMSWITSALYLVTSSLIYILMKKEHWLTRERVYVGFPILLMISLMPGIWVNKYLAVILMFGAQFVGSARFSILDKYLNKEFASQHRATASSTINMGVSLAMALTIYIGGYVQSMYDSRASFTFLGIISFLLIVPLAVLLTREHHRYELAKKVT